MISLRLQVLALLIVGMPLPRAVMAQSQESRYVAVFADGSRVDGKQLNGWSAASGPFRLDSNPLFGAGRSLRWLRDRSLPPGETSSNAAGFVEFANGDRLPGELVRFEQPGSGSVGGEVAHLVVSLGGPSGKPAWTETLQVRIFPQFVRRIVWKDSQRTFSPGTLIYQDGRELAYQSLRWQREAVEVLTSNGICRAAFAELAEITLPVADPWRSYCEELALVNPDLSALMVRLETTHGAIVTTAECASWRVGVETNRGSWQYKIQPAWSLDPIAVQFAAIRTFWSFAPHELPLSRFRPARVVRRPMLAQGWQWQLDRNVQNGPLRNKVQEHGWGFGVQASCELWFNLPRYAQAFRTRAGLDAIAGNKGCARALVYANKREGSPLYRSELLIGSSVSADTGVLTLPGPAGDPKTLILVADAASQEGPPGSDPLDIRDMLDWIEPMLLLSADRLKADVQGRNEGPLLNNGWTLKVEGGASPRWRAGFEEIEKQFVNLLRGICTEGRALTLSRQQEIPADADGLLLPVRQVNPGSSSGRLEIRVDGRPVARCPVPPRDQRLPLFVSLKPYVGRKVGLELVYQPGNGKELLDLRPPTWAKRANLTFWRPAKFTDVYASDRLPIELLDDGAARIGRHRPVANIQFMRAQPELRTIGGFRLDFNPEGELLNIGEAGNTLSLQVSLAAVSPQQPILGRYVRVELPPEANYPLALAEVEVYRDSPTSSGGKNEPKAKTENSSPPAPVNMARGGTASQSSIAEGAEARRAIDGGWGFAKTRSRPDGDPNPWWEVDLGETKPIDYMEVLKQWSNWNQEYRVSVLDERRNTVWRTSVDRIVHVESTPVTRYKDVRIGPCPAAQAGGTNGPAARPAENYSAAYTTSRPSRSYEPLWFLPESPIELRKEEDLLLRLRQEASRDMQILGHFRLWVTADRPTRGTDGAAVEVPLLPQ